ncbi:putative pentatricopeptide repeat-containing protein At5g43820 [Phragmites australis]|uniref:putative pentatricopeptide repeat-containing protein At5g43820 n=1 Tax=Phragmites australis TaxID=29695 RepID=UPI002D76BC36|nr:putative pentatricopeptide repeat-containing protein At5g43820 [Phragmites australis]XP_062223459.1 putative pentatricopeptide repeat-containing protein At5g43820 [Phragmites australis]
MAARRLLHLRSRSYSASSAAEDLVVSSLRLLSIPPHKPTPLPPHLHSKDPSPDTPTRPPPPSPTALLLSTAQRLRGVFLRKPPGRAELHRALSSTGLDAAAALSPEVLADVVNAGDIGGAATVAFFDWAVTNSKPPPSVHTCNIVIRALGRKKFFDFLKDTLEIMRKNSIFPDLTTLEIIVDSLVAARHVSRAVQMISTDQFGFGIGKACHRKEAFTILIRCLCRRSHVGLASSLLQAAHKELLGLDNHAYNEVVGGWARFGRVDKLEEFWARMQEDGLVPDEVSHCHLIEALGRAGRVEEALRVFENMVHEGYGQTTTAYNAIIFNFVSIGDLDRCIKYYKDMVDKNCPPNIDTYLKMIIAFLKERRVADALQMFDDMLARGILPNTGVITSFIEPLCTFGPPHAALMIYKKSRKAGCIISLKAYKLLLERHAKFGKSGIVLKIWEEMQGCGYPSDKEIYEFIVNGLCNVGKVDAAVSVVEGSLRKGFCLGRVVYSKLNNKLLEMNKVETAYNLFKKVKDVRVVANSRNYCRANGWHS